MPEPPRRRVAAAAKRTACIFVRLTKAEAAMLARLVEVHKPPTASSYVRDLLNRQFDQPLPRPAEK